MIALVCCVVCWLDDCLLLVDLLSFVGLLIFVVVLDVFGVFSVDLVDLCFGFLLFC